jgi:two-component system cell cycle response regulator CpdR
LEALMSRRVLIVDDEPIVLEMIASTLDDLGCEVLTASNGADALDRLSSDPHI